MRGVRGAALILFLGAVAALSMPPFDIWPVWFFGLPVMLLQLDKVIGWRGALLRGWLFGFGYFCVVLHWIAYAFFVDAATYLWMMPFAVGGLAAVMAVYWGLAAVAARLLERWRFPTFFGFPLTLAMGEWLRGHLMTGFPWAVPGLAADGMGGVAQLASVVGMTGLTLLVLLWAAALAAPFLASNRRQTHLAFGLLSMLPVALIWGQWRLSEHPTHFVDGVDVRIVQPNLSQDEKWRADNASKSFDDLIAASTAPAGDFNIRMIVWPESAVAFLIDESEGAKNVIRHSLVEGQFLLTGTLRRSRPDPSADYFTSIIAFDHTAKVVGVYDKWRLVPGGEFLPFAAILQPLGFQKIVSLPGGFVSGPGAGAIELPDLGRLGALVCYEVAFPNDLVAAGPRPKALINVTNDGWFGQSTGPYQHLAQVRMRAIEQGLPILRSANTGISAVFDAYGREVASLGLGKKGYLDVHLPVPSTDTFYSRYGDWTLAGMVLLVALGGIATASARKLS